jgi:hypothetical protein
MKKNHMLWMILGCGIPLLVIFLAPALGIGGNTSLFLFIILMFGFHLVMPMQHGGHKHSEDHNETDDTEHHQEEHKGHQHH